MRLALRETIARAHGRRSERGATATEYGLLVGFIAFVIVTGVGLFGTALDGVFARFAATLAAVL